MTIENMRCFVNLAECLNFARTAEKEHITQSAMSRKIGSMEEELGIILCLRDNRQVTLTNAGKEFYYESLKMLDKYDSTVRLVRNVASGFQKELRIGIGIYEHILLNRVLGQFISQNPEIKISCSQFDYHLLLLQFQQNNLDIIITSDQFLTEIPENTLEKELIYCGDWNLGIPAANSLSQFSEVRYDQLNEQVLITMHEGTIEQIRDYYHQLFSVNFRETVYVNSYEAKLSLISANRGIGFFPGFIEPPISSTMVFRKLTPSYHPREFYVVQWKNNGVDVSRQFLQMCKENCIEMR